MTRMTRRTYPSKRGAPSPNYDDDAADAAMMLEIEAEVFALSPKELDAELIRDGHDIDAIKRRVAAVDIVRSRLHRKPAAPS